MTVGEFLLSCLIGALGGYTVGAVLADPHGVLAPIWWSIVDVVTYPVRWWQRNDGRGSRS